jgi:hypothetical protein
MSNPNPTYRYPKKSKEELAPQVVGVRLPVDMDKYVRSLPNKTEWLRQAIAAQIERDMQQQQTSA